MNSITPASLDAQIAQIVQAHSQNNGALNTMYAFARRLGMPDDAPRDITSLDDYNNDELMRRMDIVGASVRVPQTT